MLLLLHGSNLPWLYTNTNHSSFQVMTPWSTENDTLARVNVMQYTFFSKTPLSLGYNRKV